MHHIGNIIVFHIQYEVEQMLFRGQLIWLLGNVVWFPNEPHMTNDGGDHKLCQLLKLKLVKDLNKLGVAHMVVKTSHTPMLWSTNCPPPSFNFVGVKYSQVLTHVIMACTII